MDGTQLQALPFVINGRRVRLCSWGLGHAVLGSCLGVTEEGTRPGIWKPNLPAGPGGTAIEVGAQGSLRGHWVTKPAPQALSWQWGTSIPYC